MATKRKSDAMESAVLDVLDSNTPAASSAKYIPLEPAPKKPRVSAEASGSGAKGMAKSSDTPQTWKDIKLEGEDEGCVPVYDDCSEVRRKIRLLQKTPDWKMTHWLKEIGGINSNSFSRFMSAKAKDEGAANGTYYSAYVYFEKVRILQNKKKTATRNNNETMHSSGFPLENRRKYIWARG